MPAQFEFKGLFAKDTSDIPIAEVRHAKYDFAVAYPPPETMPMDGLLAALQSRFDACSEEVVNEMAYYPHKLGWPRLRELAADKLAKDRNFKVSADDVVLTAGSGEAINLLIKTLVDPGERVVTEKYVYAGTLNQLRNTKADIIETDIDEYGMVPEELNAVLARLQATGKQAKFIYIIPEHQNPTGSTMPVERRHKILEIAHQYGVPIMEDDCYVDLRFEGELQTSFRGLDDSGIVLHVASFSKLVSPGLRLGYFVATPEVIRRAMSIKHGSGPNQLAAYAVDGFLRQNLDSHRANYTPLLKDKRDAMAQALQDHFSGTGASWSKPQGGCYTWLTMPEGTDITVIRDTVFDEGVGYLAGVNFSPSGRGQNCARLCFAFESVEKNYEGIALLARLFKKHNVI